METTCKMSKIISVNFFGQSKYVRIISGVGSLYIGYLLYRHLKQQRECDDYFKTLKWQGGGPQRYILVLGLKGAGKTRLLQCFQPASFLMKVLPPPEPTLGHIIHSVGIAGTDFHFWEVGQVSQDGGEPVCGGRQSHPIDVIIWVVDSTQPKQFSASSNTLHQVVASYESPFQPDTDIDSSTNSINYGVPVIIVASKQDLPNSAPLSEVFKAMHTEAMQEKHKVFCVGTQVPDLGERSGLWRLYELLAYAELKRFSSKSAGNDKSKLKSSSETTV